MALLLLCLFKVDEPHLQETRNEDLLFVAVWFLSHVQLFSCPMDSSLPGSSVHGILQARKLEWVAISFSRGSSLPRDPARVSGTAGGFFTA